MAGKGISGSHRHPLQSRLAGGGFRTGPGTANGSFPHPPGGPCQRGTPFRSDASGHKLAADTDHFILKIADNGQGVTAADIRNPQSLGLLAIRERAFLLGGNVDIDGKDGKGTTVTVSIPHRPGTKP